MPNPILASATFSKLHPYVPISLKCQREFSLGPTPIRTSADNSAQRKSALTLFVSLLGWLFFRPPPLLCSPHFCGHLETNQSKIGLVKGILPSPK